MVILFTARVFARNLLRENRRRYIFVIFRFAGDNLTWVLNCDLTSNKSIHYLLDYVSMNIVRKIFYSGIQLYVAEEFFNHLRLD